MRVSITLIKNSIREAGKAFINNIFITLLLTYYGKYYIVCSGTYKHILLFLCL